MQPSTTLSLTLPTVWDLIQNVRNWVELALEEADPDLRDAAVMVASELTENAVKYGRNVEAFPAPMLELSRRNGALSLCISSGVHSYEHARPTLDRIYTISEASDIDALYAQKMRGLLDQPGGSSQLGLYRICSEGKFALRAVLHENVLHVTATREYR